MGSYKEIYEIEFITRTKKIVNDYNKRKRGYKLTLLLNCLVGLIILPSERTIIEKPPLWNKDTNQIPLFTKIDHAWKDGKNHTLGEFVKKLRNGIAHQNVDPINRNNQFVGVRIWNINPQGNIDFEVKLDRHSLHAFANLVSDQYLHNISIQQLKQIIKIKEG